MRTLRQSLPAPTSLVFFEAAARKRSFSAAAAEMSVTQAAVSWQVKAREQRLGQVLFLRQPREVSLTPAGERFREGLERSQAVELERLFQRLPELDERSQREIRQFADRLMGKMLHPPLESLRDESQNGSPHGLLEALQRLFQLKD